MQLREVSGWAGAGHVHDRTMLEWDPEGGLCVKEESMILLKELSGLGTAGPADGAFFSYGAREK